MLFKSFFEIKLWKQSKPQKYQYTLYLLRLGDIRVRLGLVLD